MPKIIKDAKEHILEYAKTIVDEEGLAGLTIRNLADRAEMAVGTIYNYFPDKETLDYELLKSCWDTFIQEINEDAGDDFYETVHQIYERLNQIITMFAGVVTQFYKEKNSFVHRFDMFTQLAEKMNEIIKQNQKSLILPSGKLSQWLTTNLVMMSHMHNTDYDVFETILKKVFED